ncbi:unnamed protein product [Penicillium egyptiacum]|uniref:Uncharacterized protein n=1 Tax=Penicillium egyptiacum TaxID=1303716 RepID=A0A9W4P7A3_9EURO|nr:unnamed protein product [Penicillium egyptiacum]
MAFPRLFDHGCGRECILRRWRRVWAGAGGAGMYLGNLNLITILTTPAEQPIYVGLLGLIYAPAVFWFLSLVALFPIGSATWRWLRQEACEAGLGGHGPFCGHAYLHSLVHRIGGVEWLWTDRRNVALYVVTAFYTVTFLLSKYYCVGTNKQNRFFPVEFLRDPALKTEALKVIMSSIGDVYVTAISAGALYVVASCLLSRRRF